ncbi:unnamed protein product [Thelazia callipaeda]|uniref:BPTI/Kunitz inhibitor domain-containing protein n=1 Tax=Thelazia callipaeda TaxID=103827 RepID=A0A0N5CKN9_THECL|nr:unnamed protein product [Thelazia callipaeda]
MESRVAYYFDNETDQCLPFLYEGCGGNTNRFRDMESCRMSCIPQDYGWCAMKEKAFVDNNGNTLICSRTSADPCPEKYICKHLAFFGICCPQKTEEIYAKNFYPKCARGTLVITDDGNFNMTFLGKTCSDKFCPEGSSCIQQEIFAYCCQ